MEWKPSNPVLYAFGEETFECRSESGGGGGGGRCKLEAAAAAIVAAALERGARGDRQAEGGSRELDLAFCFRVSFCTRLLVGYFHGTREIRPKMIVTVMMKTVVVMMKGNIIQRREILP